MNRCAAVGKARWFVVMGMLVGVLPAPLWGGLTGIGVAQAKPRAAHAPAEAARAAGPAKPQAAAPAAASAASGAGALLVNTPTAFCTAATHRLPNLPAPVCAQATLVDSGARSVQGKPLWQRDVVSPKAKRKVLVIGGIHGDERSSSALVFHWIQHAVLTPSDVHWRFVPMVNPDGVLREPPTRTNANGVDLNRNFPTPNWDKEAPVYWNQRTGKDPRRWPGPKPLSEPESRWLLDEMERWKPDLIVSVHAPYGVLDFDGPVVPPQRLGRLYLDQVGIFPGSLGNWGGVHKRVPVVTIELNNARQTPTDAEMRQMWLDLLRWIGDRLGAS